MEVIINLIVIALLILIAASIINLIIALKSKSYINYKEQLRQFELKKNMIEEELKNDREKF